MVIWTTLHHPVLQCLSHHPSPFPAALLNNHHGCVSFQTLIYTHGFFSSLVILILPSPSSSHHPHLSRPVYSCHIPTPYSCPNPGHPHLILNGKHPFVMSHLSSHLIPSFSHIFTPLNLPIIF